MVNGLADVHTALVDDAVGVVDVVDLLACEAAAAQAYEVDAGVGDGLACGDDVGGNVLWCAAAALYHHVAAYVAELVYEHGGADGGKVIDDDKVFGKEDRKVKLAVRPESFEYVNKGGDVPVTVTSVEHIGRDITVNGNITDQENHVKVIIPSALRNEILGKAEISFKARRFYVFEETGERIK